MFQLSEEEMQIWKSQIVISNSEKMGLRKPPLVFTEQGVAMLSSVLNSESAIMVNIAIIRVFSKMREFMETQQHIIQKMKELEQNDLEQNEKILLILEYLNQFEESKQQRMEQKNRRPIGY